MNENNWIETKSYKKGVCDVCESVHKFCLERGLRPDCNDYQSSAYADVIRFITSRFGSCRRSDKND